MIEDSECAEIIIGKYIYEKNQNRDEIYLPKSLTQNNKEEIIVKYIDNINYRLDAFKKNIEWCKSSDRSEGDKLNEIKKNEWIIEKIDSIKISLGENVNKLLASKYILKFRANNSLGAKIIYSYFLLVDGENKIMQMEDNADRIYILNTISFPGYMELIEKYKKWE